MTPEEEELDTLRAIRERIAELQEAEKEIVLTIRSRHVNDIGKVLGEVGNRYVIEQPVKFSAAKAEEVLDEVVLEALRVPSLTITAADARKLLSPEKYAECQVSNGQPKLKFVKDEEE